MIYLDGASGKAMAKRFNVNAITRDKEYDLTMGTKGSKVLYFTANPNGESEIVNIQLSPGSSAKKKIFDFDFADIAIKGRGSQGNVVTKYPVKKITQVSVGKSSLGAMRIWLDEVSGKLNQDERGKYLGAFDTGCKLITLYKDGAYEINDLDLTKKFDVNNIFEIGKFEEKTVVSAVYHEGEKGWTMVKRFRIETSTQDQKFYFLPEAPGTKLYLATIANHPVIAYHWKSGGQSHEKSMELSQFIEVKGWKALGNKLTEGKLTKVLLAASAKEEPENEEAELTDNKPKITADPVIPPDQTVRQGTLFDDVPPPPDTKNKLSTGDTIEFDV
jgi:topoisomerase-4 subunit A